MTTNIEEKIKEKPQWLEALEKQSWQAELIASGLAIYGSLALGPLIDDAVIFISTVLPDRLLDMSVWIFIYMYLAHSVLVVAFIGHLSLRILWAGLLGLSSVYPAGINVENETFPKHFLAKAREEFPSLSDYSLHIDKICSKVFSSLCMMVYSFFAISIWLLLIIAISEIGLAIFKINITFPLLIVLGIICGIYYIIAWIFITGPKKESDFSKKYSYTIYRNFTKVLLHTTYTPASYITWTQRTNQTTKQFMFGFLLLIPISMLVIFKTINMSNLLESDAYFKMNAVPHYVNASNYLDQNGDTRIIRPIIQSKNIKENYVELFVPKLKREKLARIKICGEWETDLNKRSIEYSRAMADFNETCATKYYTISIDDQAPIDVDFQYLKHTLNNEKGIFTYIPIDTLSVGNHVLKIKTGYEYEGKFAERVIPFYNDK